MTNPTSNFGWQMPTSTDLVTDLPADFEVFGQAVDTDFVDLLGGTTGQVLSKTSNTDLDFTWVAANPGDITGVTAGTGISGGGTSGTVTVSIDTAVTADLTTSQTLTNKTLTSPALTTPTISTLTTNGDILYGTGTGAIARLGIGTTGQNLTVAGGLPSWATASSGGMTLLSTTTLTSTTTTISSISASYKDLIAIYRGVNSGTGNLGIRTNGITTGNYYAQTTESGVGLPFAGAFTNGGTEFLFSELVPTDANNTGYLKIYDYANTSAVFKYNETALYSDGNDRNLTISGVNRGVGTNAISSITFFSPTGGTIAGTVLLYGVS